MTTQTEPTEAAKRAAKSLLGGMPHIKGLDSKIRKQVIEHAAEAFDRETGLPELIEACKAVLHDCAESIRGKPSMATLIKLRAVLKKAGEA